jgi:hypothetical protein
LSSAVTLSPCLLVWVLAGCAGEGDQFAPVSGVVRLNDKPLAGASVSFEPVLREKATYGPGSHALTDGNGQFKLTVSAKNIQGAMIGKHTVRISLGDTPKGDPGGAHLTRELLPARYNSKSELAFEVPPGGTDAANFDLKNP